MYGKIVHSRAILLESLVKNGFVLSREIFGVLNDFQVQTTDDVEIIVEHHNPKYFSTGGFAPGTPLIVE